MKKILSFLMSTAVFVLICICIIIGVNGYIMYDRVINKKPIETAVFEIQSNPNYVLSKNINPEFLNAIQAIEDKRFFKHGALDPISTVRAFFTNILSLRYVAGGSTITQQLAKNMYFSREKKLSRKVAELFVAEKIEKQYTKDEILELYVNIIYYGDNNYGIKSASENYFGKTPADLDLNEASLLAGLPKAPSYYALSKNYPGAKERQSEVLKAMVELNYITEEDMKTVMEMR